MDQAERFLITGGNGCIGAWVAKLLVEDGVPVTIFDLSEDRHRLDLVMDKSDVAKIDFIQGDITHTAAVKDAFETAAATHIVHLAALQVPFCRANPVIGAAVNVVGTVNVFEAVKALGIQHLVYASSIAVYGKRDAYESELLQHDSLLEPHTHYGVYKQANEGTARIYWQDDNVSSIGLRPYTLYGPARDQGMTSEPTKAMLAAARGQGYHIPFGGKNGFQYTRDIAQIFIAAARADYAGCEAFNISGSIAHMRDVIAAIEAAVPEVVGQITFDDVALPFPDGQAEDELRALLGELPYTPLVDGVAATISKFKQAIADGNL